MSSSHRAVLVAAVLVVSLVGAVAVVGAAPAAASHEGDDCSFPVTVTDNTDTEVTVEEAPESVVVIDAASAQTLWEIGAEDRVVGMPVRAYTEYLEGSEERTDVLTDDGTGVETETVVDLEPDLVLAPNFTPPETIQQLRDADLTVYQSTFETSFEDIYAKTELYGHLVGECEAATETADETRQTVESVREAAADREHPRVLYYFFGTVAGEGTFIGDMVETAGGVNVAAEAGIAGFDQISEETIVERDPQWIVTTDDPGSVDVESEPFSETTAGRQGNVLEVDADLASQAGPRVVEPLQAMADAFAEPIETPTPTAEPETPTPTESDGASDDAGDDEDLAGFGAAVAVVALTAAALLARRR